MRYYVDLHIHSKYSRATSRNCDLENLTFWGRKKGINVIATGDFTHPAWFQEIKDKLVPAEPGLFKLKPELEKSFLGNLPPSCIGLTRFILSVEISTIYKKGDKTRKVHHLLYAPTIEKADRIRQKLGKIGNIRSDGRPILGLDSRHLLEITLEAGDDCFLIPAHIWTPWFSVLGSKSGFDRISDCYGDLAHHIFAAETGLSSDPDMNWRVSDLDKYRLVSNSDAHSPQKLGREACVFNTEMDYYAIKKALETGNGYEGTVEFFPEEGKYHMDGHRKCNIRFTPEESKENDGICPACRRPLTLGVLHRVSELADRPHDVIKPAGINDFKSLIPLPEIISETLGVGPTSKKVSQTYEQTVAKLGNEFGVLHDVPLDHIRKNSSELITEAISRMRSGNVIREAGYDGEYGVIKLFKKDEIKHRASAGVLFDIKPESHKGTEKSRPKPKPEISRSLRSLEMTKPSTPTLDHDQQKAVEITEGPLLIVAGPGSGKTRVLTHRVAHLIAEKKAKPEECLTITFTRRAAGEMQERLEKLAPKKSKDIPVLTFHGLALQILKENRTSVGLPRGFRVADETERSELLKEKLDLSDKKVKSLLRKISLYKRTGESEESLKEALSVLEKAKETEGLLDYDDLIVLALKLLEEDKGLQAHYREKFPYLSIDEYQDIDALQYRLVQLITKENGNICVIGDPDQAIYSFRGADVKFFLQFEKDFPKAQKVSLNRNYRTGESIITASHQMMAPDSLIKNREVQALIEDTGKVMVHHAKTDKAEAEFVVSQIEKIIGGVTFFSIDSGRSEGREDKDYSFSDFAVLYRTEAQGEALEEAFSRLGIPFQRQQQDKLLEEIEECKWDAHADRVSLLTLHAAKGLEFPVVFVTGCENGILPLQFGPKPNPKEIAEERRLFFVGMTRSKDRLFLTHARKRLWRGKVQEQEISPFLTDIEEALLERHQSTYKGKKKDAQLELI